MLPERLAFRLGDCLVYRILERHAQLYALYYLRELLARITIARAYRCYRIEERHAGPERYYHIPSREEYVPLYVLCRRLCLMSREIQECLE
jgi:hypothetical protein